MVNRYDIDSLSDFFSVLFKDEDDRPAVIRGRGRLSREDYFSLFFPKGLCDAYLGKSRSNLTWFFLNDPDNRAVKRTLIHLLKENARGCVDEVHQKCRDLLWPQGTHASFDRDGLYGALMSVRLAARVNRAHGINRRTEKDVPLRVDLFFESDPSAALARMILTLAVQTEADLLMEEEPDLFGQVWSLSGGDHAFMKQDRSVEGRIRYYRTLDLEGRRTEAFNGYRELAEEIGERARSAEESRMLDRMGEMLLVGDGHYADRREALRAFERACFEGNPASYYILSRHSEHAAARAALEKAAELGCAAALREWGNALFFGSVRLGYAADIGRARDAYRAGMKDPGEDGAFCTYMLGRVYEAMGETESALGAYRFAEERGAAEASERLAGLNVFSSGGDERRDGHSSKAGEGILCVCCGMTGANAVLVKSLGGARVEQAEGEGFAETLRRVLTREYTDGRETFPDLVVALLSDDRDRNLSRAVEALEELRAAALRLKERGGELTDCAEIYLNARREPAAAVIDTAQAGMGRLYFRVRLCDYGADAADDLFSRAPLFRPLLTDPGERQVRLNIIGTGDCALELLCRAMALPMPEGTDLSVTVYGRDAEGMKARFEARCPGFFASGPQTLRTVPRFCALSSPEEIARVFRDMRHILSNAADPDKGPDEAKQRLARGNYYIAAAEKDEDNLAVGILLRRELLKSTPSIDNTPLIAVAVRDPAVAGLALGLSSGSPVGTGKKYRHYDLFPFGSLSMYTYGQLTRGMVERRARALHCLYSGGADTPKKRREALSSYYKKQYNRDSCRLTALAIVYRLYQAGIALPSCHLYGSPEEARLGGRYSAWLAEGDHLEKAARLEHGRWNAMMLSLGWEPASLSQVSVYVQNGNPGHQMYIGRLHPFIAPWEALEDGELLRGVAETVHARYPEKTVHDPREADRASVQMTERLLSVTDGREERSCNPGPEAS